MTELLAVPFDKLYTSEKLSLREMALVEPLTIGYHAVMRGRVAAGDTVGVFGCGAIGIGVIAAAAGKGATVIAIDVADEKLALAQKVGAKHVDQLGARRIARGPASAHRPAGAAGDDRGGRTAGDVSRRGRGSRVCRPRRLHRLFEEAGGIRHATFRAAGARRARLAQCTGRRFSRGDRVSRNRACCRSTT